MNKIEIFVRHEAELDALDCFQYIRERNPDAAMRFLQAIDRTIEGLVLHPLKGMARHFRGTDLKNIRSWRVNGFENYLLFYRFDGTCLEIPYQTWGDEIPSGA